MSPGWKRLLWTPTAWRREYAAGWLPTLRRDDDRAVRKVDHLLQSQPACWLNVLAGMPSTRWMAILRPHGVVGQHVCCGPSRREVQDLGRVICGLHDEAWLQHRYPGPLNYTGQERLEQQSAAIHSLLSRCVVLRQEAHLHFAVHVGGDAVWQQHHSPDWPAAEADRALERVWGLFDIYPDRQSEEHRLC